MKEEWKFNDFGSDSDSTEGFRFLKFFLFFCISEEIVTKKLFLNIFFFYFFFLIELSMNMSGITSTDSVSKLLQ